MQTLRRSALKIKGLRIPEPANCESSVKDHFQGTKLLRAQLSEHFFHLSRMLSEGRHNEVLAARVRATIRNLADLNRVAEALRTQIDRQNARLAKIGKLRRQWAAMLPTGSRHLMQ